ncbi:MAG: COR domain-containing protein, partial [Methylococcales bacterium]|nr:COR domain-containing protein [Methylococcales bacterium]
MNIELDDLAPLAALVNLQQLICYGTQVADLFPLAALVNLRQLDCSYTQVVDLAPLAALVNLQQLNCYGTQVVDLSPLAALANLQQLDCSETSIVDLSPIVPLIQQEIPVIWEEYYHPDGKHIHVHDCPLICPPVEIARDSPQAVRDYFEELGEGGHRLNEVKVIFLGEASAGKTSLVKRLMGERFDKKESQTHGIRIRKAPFTMDDGEVVTAHLWDFGGQEVMHATHQFFLSQRSVYVLLLNSRNDDQAEKWLKHAESFGGRSPVLVVLNKIDENPSFEVERKSLHEKYPQIRDFFRLSCAEENNKGLAEFREALRREIDRSDTRRTPFPAHWLEVKEHFSTMQADYIESAEYRRVCTELGVTRPLSQDVLLQFLHDLGVVINFRNLQYFDTQILNPLWLTNGVYRIINSGLVAGSSGLLREADFDAV